MDTATDREIGLVQAAMALGVSWHQAWRLMLTGQLQGRKVGRLWMVTTESLERVNRARQAAEVDTSGRHWTWMTRPSHSRS